MSLHIFPDSQTAARATAVEIVRRAEAAQTRHGHFTLVLSGGSTPRAVYHLLATSFQNDIDWSNVYVFWGDERCVPPDHADSNYHMARLALLDFVPIPGDHIYRFHAELEPETAASAYESALRTFFDARSRGETPFPRFDLVLLGMGDDAHTASLFPGTPALDETERWVAAQYVEKLATWRLTLTPPALNAAESVLFLATGSGKASALAAVLEGEYDPQQFPSQLIQPASGNLSWYVDEAAAAFLTHRG
jgi:6-phosphogluconolactonase